MGRHGRTYSKMKAKPRDYRYAIYERGPVPKVIETSNDKVGLITIARSQNKKIKKKANKKGKKKKGGKSKEYFVWDFDEVKTIYPS